MFINESTFDRIIRATAAAFLVIAALALGVGSGLGIAFLVVSAILFVTAAVGFCPLYRLLGLRTNKATADHRVLV
jgi:hypothetical protein